MTRKGYKQTEEHKNRRLKNNPFKRPEVIDKLKIKSKKRFSKKDKSGKCINASLYGKKHTEETKRKISESMMGENNPSKRMEVRNKISNSKKGFKHSEKTKSLFIKIRGGKGNPMFGKHHSLKSRRKMAKARIDAIMNGKYSLKPNNKEKILISIMRENNIPFNYVGDGKIWFKGKTHSFNPDFLSKNPKHIIELFGDYWHNRPERRLRDKERLQTYKKYGYNTLVIWESELKDKQRILNRIKDFIKL